MIETCDYCGKEAYVKVFPYVVKGQLKKICPECHATHKYLSKED